MHFDDLAPMTYGPPEFHYPTAFAIGWLENGHPFTTGVVPAELVERLEAIQRHFWAPYLMMGPHFCDLCPTRGAGGAQNLWIPGERCVYVAPQLVTHYIEEHQYKPPDEFIQAALACPPLNSPAYFEALRAHGIVGEPIPYDS